MNDFKTSLISWKEGTATEEESLLVIEEIDKYKAIMEHLEEEYADDFQGLEDSEDMLEGKRLSRKVNFRLIKIIISTLIALTMVGFMIVLACNLYFYNPNQGIQPAYGEDGQLLIDMMAVTEIHFPGYATLAAKATRTGIGSYQMIFRQNDLFEGNQETHIGYMIRGKINNESREIQEDYLHFPVMNSFGYREGIVGRFNENGEEETFPSKEELQWQLDELEELPKSSQVAMYVSFQKDLSMNEMSQLYEQWRDNLCFAYVAIEGNVGQTIGFAPDYVGATLENVSQEEYPYFQLFGHDKDNQEERAKIWEEHFTTLLHYLSNRAPFLNAMININGISESFYEQALNYVDKNGVKAYGTLIYGGRDNVLSFLNQIDYFDFYINDVKLSNLSRN